MGQIQARTGKIPTLDDALKELLENYKKKAKKKKNKMMSSGELFDEYRKSSKHTMVNRSYRNYMNRMKELGFVRETGSRRWKKYEIVL